MNNGKRVYSLLVAVTMIVGIVVGSGIYFKVDDILNYTGGNVYLGALLLMIGSLNIIFGALSLSEMAIHTNKTGGIFEYFNSFVSKHIAVGVGWFNTFVFLPATVAVVAWVAGVYICNLFSIDNVLENQIIIAFLIVFVFSVLNVLSRYTSGVFQSFSTIIKLMPLFLIGILGLVYNVSRPTIPAAFQVVPTSDVGWNWLAAIVPITFAYEGWAFVLNITTEIKNPQKNIKRALILGPVLILSSYLIFFLGMSQLLGSSFIMSTKDLSIQYALDMLLGEHFSKLFFVIVIISILGVVNGIILSGIRLPQALSEKNMLPFKSLSQIDAKYQVSIRSSLCFTLIIFAWLIVHYVTMKFKLLGSSDVSEIAIVFYQLIHMVLYANIIRLYKKGVFKNRFSSYFAPFIAIACCAFVLIGSLVLSPIYGTVFLLFCSLVCLLGYIHAKKTTLMS